MVSNNQINILIIKKWGIIRNYHVMVNINKSFLNVFKGFVRFSDMNDQREALIHMNGFVGIHGHPGEPIKVKSLMINLSELFLSNR